MNLYKVTMKDNGNNPELYEQNIVVDTYKVDVAANRISEMYKHSCYIVAIEDMGSVTLESRTALEMNSGMMRILRESLYEAQDEIERLKTIINGGA